jgi:hypothetical protein
MFLFVVCFKNAQMNIIYTFKEHENVKKGTYSSSSGKIAFEK